MFAGIAALGLAAGRPALALEPVDVELILAVDVSLSMSPEELEIQRKGYVAALTHERVIAGDQGRASTAGSPSPMSNGPGQTSQHVIVPWTVIASAEDAAGVRREAVGQSAEQRAPHLDLERPAIRRRPVRRKQFRGLKRVVDVSGDGANNQGVPVDRGPRRDRRAGHHHQRPAADDQGGSRRASSISTTSTSTTPTA